MKYGYALALIAMAGCADPAREVVRAADYGERWPLRAGFPEAGQARKDSTPGPLADFIERAGALCAK